MAFSTAKVTAVLPTMEVQLYSDLFGVLHLPMPPFLFGSDTVGIQYMPKVDDVLLIENIDNHHIYIVGSYISSSKLQTVTPYEETSLILKEDELIIFNKSGATIRLNQDGSIYLLPGSNAGINSAVIINNPVLAKKVVLDGDTVTVSGTDSAGESFTATGHVTASSRNLKAT